MSEAKNLNHLGNRIAIIGPSSSGKSTLAEALGQALDLPVCHLDQIAHRHGSNWERVPDDEFIAAHDGIIAQERWVMEGNYSVCMKPRFSRASAVIWLDPALAGCIWRYLRRTWRGDRDRPGNLQGARSQFSFDLIRYTLRNYPQNRRKYRQILAGYPDLPLIIYKKLVAPDDLYV